jgi:hypothetical protein
MLGSSRRAATQLRCCFIDERLRYLLPWENPSRVVEYLASHARDPSAILLWGGVAEKFGEWWDREKSRAWLGEFLERLRFERRVATVHPSEYLREHGVRGYLHLDTGPVVMLE